MPIGLNVTETRGPVRHTAKTHRFTDDALCAAVRMGADSLCRCGRPDQPGHEQCLVAIATLAIAHIKLVRGVLAAGDADAVRRDYTETATVLKLEAAAARGAGADAGQPAAGLDRAEGDEGDSPSPRRQFRRREADRVNLNHDSFRGVCESLSAPTPRPRAQRGTNNKGRADPRSKNR